MSASASNAASGENPPAEDDWRKSVSQAYRSEEVRGVAKVLAALESGATANSKLMLAMRFEENIFKSASSLSDYRKKLTKRLKKVQKSFKAPAPTETGERVREKATIQLEKEIRDRYGEELKFIVDNAKKAVAAMVMKRGTEQAKQLKLHTDNAEQWAVEVGLIPEGSGFGKKRKRVPRENGALEKIKMFLEQRVENIRSHVVKLVEPDRFLEETLVKVEEDMDEASAEKLNLLTRRCLKRLGLGLPASDVAALRKLLDKATFPVPAPRKGQDQDIKDASIAYIERVKIAAQAMVGFLTLDANGKAQINGALKKLHASAVEGIQHLEKHYVEEETKGAEVVLEDAWNNSMEFTAVDNVDVPATTDEPAPKRIKTSPLVIKTRVLFAPGRKIPSHLLPALEAKKAQLLRPNEYGSGARLKVTFGSAFEMIIFFSPLLVTIRAMPDPNREESLVFDADSNQKSEFREKVVDGSLPTWTSPLSGLGHRYNAIEPIIAKKLDFASARATFVLRQCFTELAGASYGSTCSDFEVEISEGTTLLRFLQIARTTYEKQSSAED